MADHTPIKNSSHIKELSEYLTPLSSQKLKFPNKPAQTFYPGYIREGDDFQADVPDIPQGNVLEESRPNDLSLWSPSLARSNNISDEALWKFILTAKEDHGFIQEQALGMIAWKRYDMEAAKEEMARWTPDEHETNILETPSGPGNTVLQVFKPRS